MKIKNCRVCGSDKLIPIFSVGPQYISNFIKSKKEQGEKIPLNLVLCKKCSLLQLEHNAPDKLMWNENYGYQSGISSTIKSDLKDIVNRSQCLKEIEKEDIVVDIGANDFTMLNMYEKGKLVGFEPCKNLIERVDSQKFKIINNFFNAKDYKKQFKKKAKIITAISMFYDLENPNKFLEDIKECLDKDGLFVIQQNYLVSMLEQNAFDNILHEHRSYQSFTSLKYMLKKQGLEIFDIELNNINGGSIRTYIKFKENASIGGFEGAEERIKQIEEKEKQLKLDTKQPYLEFALRIEKIKEDLIGFLKKEKKKGKKIAIYGAGTRGNVALQYFGLNRGLIDCIADKNSSKWGKKTIGSMIQIVSPEEMRKIKPDFLLINTWHFAEEVINQEKEFYEKGGKFIVALPKFKVIGK